MGFESYGGVIKVREEDAVKWNIEDDDVQIHSTIIHNVNYVPEAPICLISPQHWAKPDGTWCSTKAKNFILYWNQERYNHTIHWDAGTNTVHICLSPSTNTCNFIVTAIEEDLNSEDKAHVLFYAALVSDDEDDRNEGSLKHRHIYQIERRRPPTSRNITPF